MLHYTTAGTGKTVVLLHGFCENNTCFNEQVLLLKAHCKVIMPDLPGAGKSVSQTNSTMETMADAVYHLLISLGESKVVLIGHSMGGYVTLAFAKKYSHMLSSFGLLHSTAKADSEERKLKRDQAKRLITENGPSLYTRNFIPPLFHHSTPQEVITPYVNVADDFTTEGLSEALTAMRNREDSVTFLEQTTFPVFWGIGKYDELIPQEDMLQQSLLCKQSYVAYLNNSAHMGHLEEPKLLSQHILRFIS